MFSTDVCLISDGADDITGHDTVIVTNLKAETLHALGRRPTILGRSSAPGGCVVGAVANAAVMCVLLPASKTQQLSKRYLRT